MNYQQQLEVVQNLLVQYDSEVRIDCPFCSHKNTFVVRNDDGTLYWYCFHASCSAKGKQENKFSPGLLINILEFDSNFSKIFLLKFFHTQKN